MEIIEYMNYLVSVLFIICYAYQVLYIPVPHIIKDNRVINRKQYRYAVLICARNEEQVIDRLIESIKNQTYSGEFTEIFVVADNCTDGTAQLARRCGAHVYERNNRYQTGKGYAMKYLLEKIDLDFGKGYFDGYFVFDADNILAENYIEEMNRYFDENRVVTSYRNSKNAGENRISAGHSLWFLRESFYLHNSRYLLGHSAFVSGTGFLFSDRVYRKTGGWNFHLLTEDIEFSAWCITNGIKIAYCNTAHFYDEQPVSFSQSWKQRLRWAKGNFQVFAKYRTELVKGALHGSFSCFDMLMTLMPAAVLTIISIAANGIGFTAGILTGADMGMAAVSAMKALCNAYMTFFAMGRITTLTQWRNIHMKRGKKVLYTFTFPLFMMTYIPLSAVAMFTDVSWQPIAHTRSRSLADIKQGKQ